MFVEENRRLIDTLKEANDNSEMSEFIESNNRLIEILEEVSNV
jgi:cell fate (sporulation/competence/biofilm development) regulator YlbF (YheA/YmcA/DUF963 family)